MIRIKFGKVTKTQFEDLIKRWWPAGEERKTRVGRQTSKPTGNNPNEKTVIQKQYLEIRDWSAICRNRIKRSWTECRLTEEEGEVAELCLLSPESHNAL